MDEHWREQLDRSMSEELVELELKARTEGDYCEKHGRWIGATEECPFCEIAALNEKCCPGDLKPSTVAKWPIAARRAFMYFQTELERLRADEKRLDWLEKRAQLISFVVDGIQTRLPSDPLHLKSYIGRLDVRTAIDAAMKEE